MTAARDFSPLTMRTISHLTSKISYRWTTAGRTDGLFDLFRVTHAFALQPNREASTESSAIPKQWLGIAHMSSPAGISLTFAIPAINTRSALAPRLRLARDFAWLRPLWIANRLVQRRYAAVIR